MHVRVEHGLKERLVMEQDLAESDLWEEIQRLQAELKQLAEERGSVLDALVLEKSQALDCCIVAYQKRLTIRRSMQG